MDFPDAQTPPSPAPWGRAAAAATVLALALYAVLLALHVGAVAGGSDSSGYMNQARLLASGATAAQARTVAGLPQSSAPRFLYVPLGFKPALDGKGLVPTYPAGLPLLIVAAMPFAGWRHAGDLTLILNSLLGLAATYGVGRALGLARAWAVLAAGVVALSPVYLFMSLQAMSDVPSLAWSALAVLAALKSRERPAWALAAGAAFALDVLLRPTNVLALAPVAVALGTSPRRWVLFAAGGLPGALFLCVHNVAAYGSFATTGYGNSAYAFGARYVPGTLLHYGRWLPVLFTPFVVLNAGLPWMGSQPARTRMLLVSWIVVFAAFYSTYVCTHETWWYLRFLLPAAPALAVGAVLVLGALLARAPAWADPARSTRACLGAFTLLAAGSYLPIHSLRALSVGKSELRYGLVADWMQRNLPPDAVCLTMQASGALFYYTQFAFVRWDALEDSAARVEAAVRSSGRPLYAVLFPFEITESDVLGRQMPGHWSRIGLVQDVTIWRRDFDAANPATHL